MQRPSVSLSEWIAQARAGSDDALGECLQACRAYLLLIAREEFSADLMAKAGASDIVQDTFLEAQRDFSQFHGESEEEFLGWLRTILLHNMANLRRRYRDTAKRRVSRELSIDGQRALQSWQDALPARVQSPSSHAIRDEQETAIDEALLRLPDEYRLVICLRNRDGWSFDEIGASLDKTANAARKLWSRAIERLQRELDDSS